MKLFFIIAFVTFILCFQNCGSTYRSISHSISPSMSCEDPQVTCSELPECIVANGKGELVADRCVVKSCLANYQVFNNYCVPVPPNMPFVPPLNSLRDRADKNNLKIGTAVSSSPLSAESMYANTVKNQMNLLVAENHMKWEEIHPLKDTFDFTKADDIVEFAIRNSQKVHGHTLVWHNQNPPWLTSGNFPISEKKIILENHIKTVIGHYKQKYPGVVVSWDVVNEAFLNSDAEVQASTNGGFRNTIWSNLGTSPEDYIKWAFQWAREADPNALLYYNDYSNESLNPKSTAVYSLISRLKSQGTPIDVVGMQVHMSSDFGVPTVALLRQNIARYKALGVKVHYTEFDVRTNSSDGVDATEKLRQQQLYANVFEACRLEAPACVGVTLWGFTSKYSWIPSAFPGYTAFLPFDNNYAPTEFFNIILSKWP